MIAPQLGANWTQEGDPHGLWGGELKPCRGRGTQAGSGRISRSPLGHREKSLSRPGEELVHGVHWNWVGMRKGGRLGREWGATEGAFVVLSEKKSVS